MQEEIQNHYRFNIMNIQPSCKCCLYYEKESGRCNFNGGIIPDWVRYCDKFTYMGEKVLEVTSMSIKR